MISIQKAVEEIVMNSPFMGENIADGIINLSSFSRKIKPEIEAQLKKEVQPGSIIMALKRFSPRFNPNINPRIRKILDNVDDIIVRSKIIYYEYMNSESLVKKQVELLNLLSEKKNVFYFLSQGINETTIVISATLANEIDNIFKNETLTSKIPNLSAITVILDKESIVTPGVFYMILRNISWEGINIIDVISTTSDLTVMVDNKEVDRAFSILQNLSRV